jgi:hypothetical protein
MNGFAVRRVVKEGALRKGSGQISYEGMQRTIKL